MALCARAPSPGAPRGPPLTPPPNPTADAVEGMGEADMPSVRAETWRAMEEALRVGKARAIGVSNFTVAHLKRLKLTATVWPPAVHGGHFGLRGRTTPTQGGGRSSRQVNQVECHPKFPQEELRAYCAQEGIVFQAYASLGGQDAGKAKWESIGGTLLATPAVLAAAAAHGATAAQVLLRWALQHGAAVIPKTSSEERMRENAACLGFSLSADELAAIDELAQGRGEDGRLCWRADPLRMLGFE